MQVDVLSYKIKDFIALARQAGCTQVFIGMESINDDNLRLIRNKMMRQTIATSSMPGMRLIFLRMLALLLAFPLTHTIYCPRYRTAEK